MIVLYVLGLYLQGVVVVGSIKWNVLSSLSCISLFMEFVSYTIGVSYSNNGVYLIDYDVIA